MSEENPPDGDLLERAAPVAPETPAGPVAPEASPAPSAQQNDTTQTIEIPGPAVQAIVQMAASQFHQGRIPDAESFERYELAVPGAGDRILRMAEKEQYFRLERAPLESTRQFIGRMTGQATGFLSLLTIVGAGTFITYTASNGYQVAFACALMAAPMLGALERVTDFFRKK